MMNQFLRQPRPQLLRCYVYGTWPLRWMGVQVARGLGRCPIPVLYYHRVADRSMNSWTISNRDFRNHIDWLSQRFAFISLAEAQQRLVECRSHEPAVCITFDDGYAENCEQALPLLIERRIPVTYFVATQYVLNDRPFPHDVALGEPLAPNSVEQIRSLADQGVDIGAHTRTHVDLGLLTSKRLLRQEITGSRDDLQQMLGRPVRYFAFPYGLHRNLSLSAVEVVREAGFAGFCSAYGGYNFPRADGFHLQRLHGDPFWPRFVNWLSFDPRIAFGTQRWQGLSPKKGTGPTKTIKKRAAGDRNITAGPRQTQAVHSARAGDHDIEETCLVDCGPAVHELLDLGFLRATAVDGSDR